MSGDDLVDRLQREGFAKLQAERRARAAAPREPSLPKRKRAAPERDAQRAVVAWLRMCGCLVQATFTEQRGNARTAEERARYGAARKASGATAGFPDLVVCAPAAGRSFFVEMKAAQGRLSDAQRAVHEWLRRAGHLVFVARSVAELEADLRRSGIELRAGNRLRLAAPAPSLRGPG